MFLRAWLITAARFTIRYDLLHTAIATKQVREFLAWCSDGNLGSWSQLPQPMFKKKIYHCTWSSPDCNYRAQATLTVDIAGCQCPWLSSTLPCSLVSFHPSPSRVQLIAPSLRCLFLAYRSCGFGATGALASARRSKNSRRLPHIDAANGDLEWQHDIVVFFLSKRNEMIWLRRTLVKCCEELRHRRSSIISANQNLIIPAYMYNW
jgi:hypothetical protein